jgi:hypothetical protein
LTINSAVLVNNRCCFDTNWTPFGTINSGVWSYYGPLNQHYWQQKEMNYGNNITFNVAVSLKNIYHFSHNYQC